MLVLALAMTVLLLTACWPRKKLPDDSARPVSVSEVRPSVLRAFEERFPGASIVWIGAFGTGTNAAYAFKFTQDGKSLAVGVDITGDFGRVYKPSR
jgi:hypothetical protein